MRRLVRNSTKAGVCHLYSTWPGSYLPFGLDHMITQSASRPHSMTVSTGKRLHSSIILAVIAPGAFRKCEPSCFFRSPWGSSDKAIRK